MAPGALVFTRGSAEEMIANCERARHPVLHRRFVGLALGKECHSYFDVGELRRLLPLQNGGRAARNIAEVWRGPARASPARQGTHAA